jgi:hypothetical protein
MFDFDGMTKEQIQAAQSRLDELCQKHSIPSFRIRHTGHKDQKWQALVLKICGIDAEAPKSRGRPKDPKTGSIAVQAYIDTEFCNIDPETGKKIPQNVLFDRIIDEHGIKPEKGGPNIETNPRNKVKKALAGLKKEMKKYKEQKES